MNHAFGVVEVLRMSIVGKEQLSMAHIEPLYPADWTYSANPLVREGMRPQNGNIDLERSHSANVRNAAGRQPKLPRGLSE
jgi:hypothetical protein